MWNDWYSVLVFMRERQKDLLRESEKNRRIRIAKMTDVEVTTLAARLLHNVGQLLMRWGKALDLLSGIYPGDDRSLIKKVDSTECLNSEITKNLPCKSRFPL
jgi:hypothetical protein